jgi:Uma2 family endonuclease
MNTFVIDSQFVHIPEWVKDLESFRRWADSDDFPENGRICYLNGEVWVDMSKEQLFSHNQIKAVFTAVLVNLLMSARVGRYFPDGAFLSNIDADLSAIPDGVFVSTKSLRAGRVRLVEGQHAGYVELEGTPDMVLEVISESSVAKDTQTLFELYWRAGIREYWLVDARGERLEFKIYRHGTKGYAATRKQAGWLRSAAFGKSFKLTRRTDALGHPDYRLAVR